MHGSPERSCATLRVPDGGEAERAISAAVIGEPPFDENALRGVPDDSAAQNACDRLRGFDGEGLRVRPPHVIVNRNVRALRVDSGDPRASIAVDAVPDAADRAELLDVEEDQLTRTIALVAHDEARRLEGCEPVQAGRISVTTVEMGRPMYCAMRRLLPR